MALIILDVVGLVPSMIGESTPHLQSLRNSGGMRRLECPFPAVTCTSQATLLTGTLPRDHGIVANGWYFRENQEIWLWRQSHGLLQREDVHTEISRRRPRSKVARWFLWYAMGAPCAFVATPRPQYKADGRKLPDVWTHPETLRESLQADLGTFPLFNFWGPTANEVSSSWIIDSARSLLKRETVDVLSVYVPHLDYDLQRFGPDSIEAKRAIGAVDRILGPMLTEATARGDKVIVWSEYGIESARAVIHPNRLLREAGLLAVRNEDGEILDPVASRAFAVADHQVAHVYVRDRADIARARAALATDPNIESILDGASLASEGLDHPRSGELLCVARTGAWFTYYPWFDDAKAPDFARCVDIHRKPGYDPCELVFDPKHPAPKFGAAWRLLKKSLGFRTTFNLIGLDPSIVKGTHGRRSPPSGDGPLVMTNFRHTGVDDSGALSASGFRDLILHAAGVGG